MFNWFIKNKKRTVLVAIAWTVLILIACLIPGDEVPDVQVPLIDKYVHFIIFAGCSFLWLCTAPLAPVRRSILVFVACIALGYIVELLQGSGITTGRSYDMFDVLADAIGSLIGVILFYLSKRFYNAKQ